MGFVGMVEGAKPIDFERLRVVLVVSVDIPVAAYAAGFLDQRAGPDGLGYKGVGSRPVRVFDPPTARRFCSVPNAFRRLGPFAVVSPRPVRLPTVRCNIGARAFLALPEAAVRHLRVPVELVERLGLAAFEAGLQNGISGTMMSWHGAG